MSEFQLFLFSLNYLNSAKLYRWEIDFIVERAQELKIKISLEELKKLENRMFKEKNFREVKNRISLKFQDFKQEEVWKR